MRWIGVAAACVVFSLTGSARAAVFVTIDKSQQQMTVSIDGAPAYRWPVSTGRAGWTTPSGSFNAIRLERVYYSKKFDDAPMPNSVFFYGGYAVHGTMEESKLGRPASHGCVRLHRANAAVLFELVRQHGMHNTRIVVSDGFGAREPLQAYAPARRTRAAESYYEPPRKRWTEERAAKKSYGGSSSRRIEMLFDTRDDRRYRTRQYDEPSYRTRPYRYEQYAEPRPRRGSRDAGFEW